MFRIATILLLALMLNACGGASDNDSNNQQVGTLREKASNIINKGSFTNPLPGEVVQGNLLITYSVTSTETITEVQLRFGNNTSGFALCQGESDCQTKLSDTVSGINPRNYGANTGLQEVSLWIFNANGQSTKVATIEINWQPKIISGLDISRSSDGSTIRVDWTKNENLNRYNVYLAATSGVNLSNFNDLAEGQARLAVVQGPIEFSNLSEDVTYYVLVTGIDGSGESAFSEEQQVVPNNTPVEPPVDPPVEPPVAVVDRYDAIENTTLLIEANQGLLLNDYDPLDQTITVDVNLVQAPQNGQVTLQTSGAFEYSPNANFLGRDNFTYQIANNTGGSAQANVSIDVAALKAPISGHSITINSQLRYSGLGEELPQGSSIGTGRYSLGNCVQYIDTICTVIGDYVENNTGGTQGQYAFTMTYGGVGVSPVLAHSISAGSNILSFTDVGDAIFQLSLFPESGGVIVGQFPEPVFSESINFGATINNDETCQNLPPGQACTIGQTGLNAGSELVASLNQLTFDIPNSSLGTGANQLPLAFDDQYQLTINTPLTIAQPGVLLNDLDDDVAVVGDQLKVYSQFNPTMGALVGLGYDEYRQLTYLYPSQGAGIYVYDRSGTQLRALTIPGEPADDFDLEVAAESLMIANTLIPQGAILVINGETDVAEIYALDPVSGVELAQLTTAFGNSHVVGGTYNTKTNSLFLLQDRVPASGSNTIAEINAQTGVVINTFELSNTEHSFSVHFGDISSDPLTGNLYVISSIENVIAEYSTTGDFLRNINLPQGVAQVSGIELSHNGSQVWLSANTGEVFELTFDNNGELPKFIAEIKQQPSHGSVVLKSDGSFTYTPENNFTGQDSFVYLCHDQNGGVSSATVVLNVN
ncbi:Ig-like domain-containing protein [Thalassotalea castellviae]|uniref:Ig-like domain-containing protein n=1 Tax=Thalassotalea castellviae TaxID=3075612 RepID=A0ABU2ZX22_9GAMM|nr:Ig-like domain-containing protein [Thalassotalea sp. W431]MDT0602466.1 Ig-like domain-containing protein [Thalassotalea sp. W431]